MSKISLFLLAISTWLMPLVPFFILTGISIAVDTWFGFRLARKTQTISSRKFSRILYKLFMYNLIIISGYALDMYVFGDFVKIFSSIELTFTKIIALCVLINELISIDEKLIFINGKGLRHYFKKILHVAKIANNERKNLGL